MRIDKNSVLFSTPIAHRGLWNENVPENSLTAYKNAAEKHIPIEIDLYFTKDKRLVSFHDNTLDRMVGKEGKIWEYTLEELKSFRLKNSDETIPTFDEVLEVCENKCPILIEIKDQPIEGLVEAVCERLKSYKGEFAVQSFNPFYINKVKKIAPEFIRGILAMNTKNSYSDRNFFERIILKNMLLNFLIKPDFISFHHEGYPLKKSKTKNKVKLCWTITNKEDYLRVKPYVDNVIYEKFDINE